MSDVPYVFSAANPSSRTASAVINAAFRKLKILAGEETLSAAEAADALDNLNTMMHGFGPKGIAYVHTTLAATDTINMPDELIESLILMLADEMSEDYGVPQSKKLEGDIRDARNILQAAYHVQPPAGTEPILRRRLFGRDISVLD